MGLGTATVSDEQIRGTLRVGQLVQAKHPEKRNLLMLQSVKYKIAASIQSVSNLQ